MAIEIEISTVSNRKLGKINVDERSSIKDVKREIAKISKISVERQSIRLEVKGKDQKDELRLNDLNIVNSKLYVKDLGPQVGWSTVFICEYAGPIFVYVLVDLCRNFIYSSKALGNPSLMSRLIYIAWIVHYAKRILETIFVHRFSHGTMPLQNLFRNCGYYWGFALYVAYHVNHPLWTEPPVIIAYPGLVLFVISELGNLSVHLLLRDLRPAGSTVRKIPYPNNNILTILFNFVSCPNYTYEFGAWIGYTLMSGCLPAFLFALAGMYQMTVWALGKHRNYKKEFLDYPRSRKAILPFIL